jgi:Tol biopolymer transport system component
MARRLNRVAVAAGALLAIGATLFILGRIDKAKKWDLPQAPGAALASQPMPEKLAAIPADAAIAYNDRGFIFVTDREGRVATQISFDGPQGVWEHVAVSPNHRFIATNEQMPDPKGVPGGISRLWVFDVEKGARTRLVPGFSSAGNGGVDWDRDGNIYFAAKDKDAYPSPKTMAENFANAGENEIYRIHYDGTKLQRLTHTADRGESDVSVSEDGRMIAYNCFVLADGTSEIWISDADGSHRHLVLKAGKTRIDSVHDPELSPDNKKVVYSRVNSHVPPNFPDNPDANTAHDIYQTNVDGTGTIRLTKPGNISIAPDWVGGDVLFLDISEKERRASAAIVKPGIADQTPQRLDNATNIAKFIPKK